MLDQHRLFFMKGLSSTSPGAVKSALNLKKCKALAQIAFWTGAVSSLRDSETPVLRLWMTKHPSKRGYCVVSHTLLSPAESSLPIKSLSELTKTTAVRHIAWHIRDWELTWCKFECRTFDRDDLRTRWSYVTLCCASIDSLRTNNVARLNKWKVFTTVLSLTGSADTARLSARIWIDAARRRSLRSLCTAARYRFCSNSRLIGN